MRMDSETDNAGAREGVQLTCRELVELVTAYRDGALSPVEHQRFEEHVADCPPCERYVEQIDLTVRAAGGITHEVEDSHMTQALLRIFRDWKASREG
ncbi:MAG TPA: zf-HC2 domain-containing protein [Ktedonobacterales bacterium]